MDHDSCMLVLGNYEGGLTGFSTPSQTAMMDPKVQLN